jgi:hypothetical protein
MGLARPDGSTPWLLHVREWPRTGVTLTQEESSEHEIEREPFIFFNSDVDRRTFTPAVADELAADLAEAATLGRLTTR